MAVSARKAGFADDPVRRCPRTTESSARMFRTLALCLAVTLSAAPARAATCAGSDLLAAMPAADRAALDATVAAAPYPSGNHWRATKGASVIDLVGTFHIHDDRLNSVAARLTPVIAAADALYVEATTEDIARLQSDITRNPALMFITTGPTLPELLAEPDWQALVLQMNARGIPGFMASKFQPWYLMILLSLPVCAMDSMAAKDQGLDFMVMQTAAAQGVPVKALEPYDTVFRIFAVMDQTSQLDLIRSALPMADQAEDMFATMVNTYFSQNHRLLWEFSRRTALSAPGMDPAKAAADFGLMEKVLLTDRNRAWMDVILPAAEGRHIVVAAGAAHLSGPDGILNLISAAGYTLERQPF
jgi:uncharacterized protein